MSDPDLAASVATFLQLSNGIEERLTALRDFVGDDQFPRAFVDILAHSAALATKATELRHEAACVAASPADMRSAYEGCTRQLQALDAVLGRVFPGPGKGGKKGASKVLKDVFAEKQIPRIQKTLHGYEQSIICLEK